VITANLLPAIYDGLGTWVATGHTEDECSTYLDEFSSAEARGTRIDFAFVDESMKCRTLKA